MATTLRSPLLLLWHHYLAALAAHPVATRSATSFVLFLVSDAAAQALAARRRRRRARRRPPPLQWDRSVRFAAFGAAAHAPACGAFFDALDAVVGPSTSWRSVAIKIVADRVLFTPALLAAAIAWMQATGGASAAATARAVAARLPSTWALSCAVWVPAHAFGFARVPLHLRVLYVNGVALVWNCVLAAVAAPPVLPVVALVRPRGGSSPHDK